MQILSVTILTDNEIDNRWPSDSSLTSYLVKTAIKKSYQIGYITFKNPVYHPEIDLRSYCLLSLEGFFHRVVDMFIIDSSELLNRNIIYVAFS